MVSPIRDLAVQLFGDGTLYFELSDFKELSGYNHLNLYGMVRPFGAESDVTFSITLTDEIVRATTIITTIPPPTSRTTLVTQTTTIPPSYTTYTPPPTDTPASPLHIECAIMALGNWRSHPENKTLNRRLGVKTSRWGPHHTTSSFAFPVARGASSPPLHHMPLARR